MILHTREKRSAGIDGDETRFTDGDRHDDDREWMPQAHVHFGQSIGASREVLQVFPQAFRSFAEDLDRC